jgi:hypothetical protein
MTALVFAQTDSTGQKVTLIVFALVAVAAALALLTAWYWRITDPALRNGDARGRGGRRNRTRPEPEPSTDPDAASPEAPLRTDNRDTSADHTRLLNRSDILEQAQNPNAPQPRTDVIDLRDPSPDTSSVGPGSVVDSDGEIEVTGIEPAAGQDRRAEPSGAVLDLDSVDQASIDTEQKGSMGAHDDGIDFDEWLALAEEDS